MHKPFETLLNNVFINARGEVSTNLDTSASKYASSILAKRQAKQNKANFLKATEQRRKEIRELRERCHALRNSGIKLEGAERTAAFTYAVEVEQVIRRKQAKIDAIAKQWGVG